MNKNRKKLFITITGIVLAIILIATTTYAWLSFRTNDIIVAGNTGCFDINYTKGEDIVGSLSAVDEKTFLTNDSVTINSSMAFSSVNIELDSKCSKINGIGTIEINVSSLETSFKKNGYNGLALKYLIVEYDPATVGEATMSNLNGRTFRFTKKGSIYKEGVTDIYSDYLSPGVKHNYLVILYINSEIMSSDVIGNVVNANITARGEQFVETPISDFEYYTGSYTSEAGETTIPSNEVLLVKYNGSDETVNVPAKYTIDGTEYDTVLYSHQARSGGNSTFSGNSAIKHVNFADGVKYGTTNYVSANLGYGGMLFAFYQCSSLISVTNIPSTTTNFLSTFQDCPLLTDISNIPDGIKFMWHAFYNCPLLTDAPVIPSSATNMNGAFSGCSSLSSAPVIPSSVTDLSYAFYNCSRLKGKIIVNSSNVSSVTGALYNTVYDLTLDVPAGSNTYNKFNGNIPSNVTLVTH